MLEEREGREGGEGGEGGMEEEGWRGRREEVCGGGGGGEGRGRGRQRKREAEEEGGKKRRGSVLYRGCVIAHILVLMARSEPP